MDSDQCADACVEYPCHLKTSLDNIDLWGDICSKDNVAKTVELSKPHTPPKYRINQNGVENHVEIKGSEGMMWISVTKTPIWIEKVYFGTDDKVFVTIAFVDMSEKIKRLNIEQKELLTKRGLLELTSYGINITDASAKNLTEYFSVALAAKCYDIGKIHNRMGWHEKNNAFVLGSKLIRRYSDHETVFVHSVPDEIVNAYTPKGTPQEWYNNLSELIKYDNVRFSIYAACTAPVLRLLGAKSFLKEDTGDTTLGKTTSALAGMSIWGHPLDLTLSTDTTAYAIEENCTIRNDLPVLLDDITLMNKDTLNRITYMVANEGGKNRGKKEGGLRGVNRWKSVVMTTGELFITGSKSTGGADVRIVSSEGGIGGWAPEAVKQFEDNMLDNYGVIGPLFIKKLLDNKKDLATDYKSIIAAFEGKITEGKDTEGIMKRLVKTYAAIAVAGGYFEEVLKDLGCEDKNSLFVVMDKLVSKLNNATGKLSDRAFELIHDWYQTESRCFCLDGHGDAGERYQLFGNIHEIIDDTGMVEYLDIIPSQLENYLDKHYDKSGIVKSFIKSWIDDGKLKPYYDKSGGRVVNTQVTTIKKGLKSQRAYRFVLASYPAINKNNTN